MTDRDLQFLKMAARLARRGHGGAEPNPLVGAVVVSHSDHVVGWGYHRTCGKAHAEIIALQRAGSRAKGATLYCTLEPCDHTGKTPPCTRAIIDAGIARVVIARRDPNPIAAGGLARLQAANIQVEINDRCEDAIMVSDPFAHRVRSGLPWVIVKWAQTIDGKIATRPPYAESQWISNAASRKLVHRERGRVDVILTGIGTVKRDDPMLTARNCKPRRIARRVVIDPQLDTPLTAKLVTTTSIAQTMIICGEAAMLHRAEHVARLQESGVDVIALPLNSGGELSLVPALRELVTRYHATNVLVESGAGLMSRLFRQKLVNEAWVFTAPRMLGDEQALSAVSGVTAPRLTDGTAFMLHTLRSRRDDIIARYRII